MALHQAVAEKCDLDTYHLKYAESDLYKVCTLVAQILTDIDNCLGWPGKAWNPRPPTPGRRRSR